MKLEDLKAIVDRLRGEDGCPWDKEQDENSIKKHLIEEAYEIVQAIEEGDFENLKEELGDLLFEILFLARIAEEKGKFDIYDAIACAGSKFIRRHPHVFDKESMPAGEEALSSGDVLKLWDRIKEGEKDKGDILEGVSKTMPALLRAHEVSRRASKVGFDWKQSVDVIDKINEEIDELKGAISKDDLDNVEEELGDIFFALVNLCRFLKVNPEIALNRTTNKFIKRFAHVQKRGEYDLKDKDLSVLESFWEEAKKRKP